jgi:oligopeptide transport system ATP-binding protein
MTSVLVEARGLTVQFQGRRPFLSRKPAPVVHAVSAVDLEVRTGETLAVVGESGCGKSTIGRALIRTVPITNGRVFFEGKDLTAMPAGDLRQMRQHFQMIFQDPYASLNPKMRIGEILAEPLWVHTREPRLAVRDRVREMLDAVGLRQDAIDQYPHEFSGGQRQRIAIARAVMLRPKFIVADEPLSALDVSLQLQVLKLFDDLRQRLSLTYFFISHDLPRVFGFADRVAVMYLGKVAEIGEASQIARAPAHPYTQALIAAVAVPDPKAEANRHVPPLRGEIPSPTHPPPGCRFHTRCPYAMPICREVEPTMRQAGAGQQAACHLIPAAAP